MHRVSPDPRASFSLIEKRVINLMSRYDQAQSLKKTNAHCPVYLEAASIKGQTAWFQDADNREKNIIDLCRAAREVTSIIRIPYIANFIEDSRQELEYAAFGGGKRARLFLNELDGQMSRPFEKRSAKTTRGAPARRIEAIFPLSDIIYWGVRYDCLQHRYNAKIAKLKILAEITAIKRALGGDVESELIMPDEQPPEGSHPTHIDEFSHPFIVACSKIGTWYSCAVDDGIPLTISETDVRKLIAAWIAFKVEFYASDIYNKNQELIDSSSIIKPSPIRYTKAEIASQKKALLRDEQNRAVKRTRKAKNDVSKMCQ
jgi:hypothetical protein